VYQILSLPIGITGIVTLAITAITITSNHTIRSVLGGIAILWLIALLIYNKRQAVYINILSNEIIPHSTKDFIITTEGSLNSRHPDVLTDLRLWLDPLLGISPLSDSKLPTSIDVKPQSFKVSFLVTYEFFEQATIKQNTDGINISFILSSHMRDADWLVKGFIFSVDMIQSGKVTAIRGELKLKMKAEKRDKGIGITEKQFHDILKEDLQHIQKFRK